MTKFMGPAKFSSCLLTDDTSMPSAPSMRPERIKAGRTAMYPIQGGSMSLTDEKIFLNHMRSTIDHGHAIGRTQGHKCDPAVIGDVDSDRLDGFLPQPRYLEGDLCCYFMLYRVDHAYRSADL